MSTVKITLVVSGAVALALASVLVAAPFGAPAGPSTVPAGAPVPPIGADELIASVRNARPGPLAGTVWVDTRLGPAASSRWPRTGPALARMWSDGSGRRRVSLPGADGERTIVDDGGTVWNWSSTTRSVTRAPAVRSSAPLLPGIDGPDEPDGPDELGMLGGDEMWGNPAATTNALLGLLAADSTATVEPTARVAGRDAYQLVLVPVPTERTMLREIRVAVDTRTRLPLEVSVLANGLAQPALRIAFSQVSFGPQDPALFRFAPARGVAVRDRPAAPTSITLVGRGWDTVLVRRLPDRSATGGPCIPGAATLGSPIAGPWGRGRIVSTPIGTTVVTSDCRVATGAVPVQVITEALGRSADR